MTLDFRLLLFEDEHPYLSCRNEKVAKDSERIHSKRGVYKYGWTIGTICL